MNNLNHVAVIMDGKGRCGLKKNKSRNYGHLKGIKSVEKIIKASILKKISYLTLYTFSTDNWKGPQTEVRALMTLLLKTINIEIKELNKKNVRFTIIGDISVLPSNTSKGLQDGIKLTKENDGLNLCLALNYGSRQEIIDAIKLLAIKVKERSINPHDISEKEFSDFLYTKDIPDPDLLIRTSGENRLSNFLLWQCAYTEIFVTDTLWPAFREDQLMDAILDFQSRERRFGKVSEQVKHII